jgi:hypothetical protein
MLLEGRNTQAIGLQNPDAEINRHIEALAIAPGIFGTQLVHIQLLLC